MEFSIRITEQQAQTLINVLNEAPFKIANPLVNLIVQSYNEAKLHQEVGIVKNSESVEAPESVEKDDVKTTS